MAINFQAMGPPVSATVLSLTVAWPTHQPNDIALLFVTSSAGGTTSSLTTTAGFTLIDSYATGSGTAGTKFSVLWARADRTNMTSPVVAAGTDFKFAFIMTFRGVRSIGDPIDAYSGNTKGTASTTASISDITTTVENAMVINAISSDLDSASPFATITNANLTSVTERYDAGTVSGTGGGIAVSTGMKAAAGATGVATATVTSSINAFFSIALAPETSFSNTFEGGVDAAAISTANSGGLSGTYAIGVPKNAGTTLNFSATHARNTMAYCVSYAVGAAGYVQWAWTCTATVRSVMRFYVYFDNLPTDFLEVARFMGAGGIMNSLSMNNKKLLVYDTNTIRSGTFPDVVAEDTWYRFEMAVTAGTTTSNGRVEFVYYHSNSTTPIYSYDSGATVNTGTADTITVRLGAPGGPSIPVVVYYDDLTVQELASGWIGPSAPPYNTNQFMPFFY